MRMMTYRCYYEKKNELNAPKKLVGHFGCFYANEVALTKEAFIS